MEALTALAGALIGGTLVLVGEALRQRFEWRRECVRRLADASSAFAILFNRMCGELIDARKRRVPATELQTMNPERHDAVTRFFLTPGCEQLREPAVELIRVYHDLVEGFESEEDWERAALARLLAIRDFETAVRAVVARGHI